MILLISTWEDNWQGAQWTNQKRKHVTSAKRGKTYACSRRQARESVRKLSHDRVWSWLWLVEFWFYLQISSADNHFTVWKYIARSDWPARRFACDYGTTRVLIGWKPFTKTPVMILISHEFGITFISLIRNHCNYLFLSVYDCTDCVIKRSILYNWLPGRSCYADR